MSQAIVKAALVQHENRGGRSDNLAYIEAELCRAAQAGATLALLQELHNGPYFCQTEDREVFAHAESIPGPTTEFLGRLARAFSMVVVGSIFERRAAGVYHNTAVVLDVDGRLVGRYRKMHIPQDPGYQEKFYFTPGDMGFIPIDTAVARLGVLICWDQWYPEAARLMALAGADILLYPSAIGWDPADAPAERDRQFNAWLTVQRGHAVANGVPLLSCNRVGHERQPGAGKRGQTFWGGSFAAGPQGEVLAQAAHDKETTLLVEIDLLRSEQIRQTWPFLRDRRIDAYQDLNRRMKD